MKANKLTKETIMNLGVKDRGFPTFNVGDTIQVAQKIKEGEKERIQRFKGDVIAMRNNNVASTFTVRRMGADNVGVEKIFPYFSPMIKDIEIIKKGDVRRAKLYYIRERIGKATRIKEKLMTKEQKEAVSDKEKDNIVPQSKEEKIESVEKSKE